MRSVDGRSVVGEPGEIPLYRVLPELAKDGKVKKNGKGWEPAS